MLPTKSIRAALLAGAALTLAPLLSRAAFAQPATAAGSADSLSLSLSDALARAQRTGDEVRLSEAQVDVTDAQVTTARAAGLPQLRLSGAYTQVIENARAQIVGSVFGQNFTYSGNANLSQTLFQGGRIVAGTQAASRARAASRADLEEARAQVTVDVQRAYLAALAADQLVRIQERNLQLSAQRLAQTEQLERAGRAARYDVLRARVERTNLEPLAIQARNDRELAYLDLKRLVNLPVDRPLRLTTPVATDSTAVLATLRGADELARNLGAESATVPAERPALRSAEATLSARQAGVRVARADFLPTVSVFFQTGLLALPSSNGFPTRFGETSNAFCPPGSAPTRVCQNNGFFGDKNFGLQVSWPLFDGLRAKGNLDLARAQANVASLQLSQTRERVALEAARARAGVQRARALWEAQRQNVQQAEEAFQLASLRQSRGLGTALEVSDAQLALLTAQTNALRATYDVYLAASELARALGRPIPVP